ncbi:MAG TPA: glycosyltransferase [Terracidiphilus sp.]|nr:glycosyltransferase [Terracidiphilus sp.]
MRLLHLIHTANPASGGPIEGIKQIASVGLARNIEIEILTLDPPNASYLRNFPVKIRALGAVGASKYGYSSQFVPWLRQNHRNYDCVIINGIWQFHSYGGWLALHKTETPYVVFTHGMLDPWFRRHYPIKHLKKWLYWPWADYRVLRDARAVLFTTEQERSLAPESFWLYRANPYVVGYGTRVPKFDVEALRYEFFARFPDLRNKRLAIFIGRIHPKKGLDLLIEAFHRTLARDPNWHLLIVGPDQIGWQADLQRLSGTLGIKDRITWTGMLQDERKWAALAASEVFVLPSHQENFGIVVAEALACGVPVLLSNQVNIWREIESANAGFVEADTLSGTVNLLEAWNRLGEVERSTMRANCHLCFERYFEIESSAGRLFELLESFSS